MNHLFSTVQLPESAKDYLRSIVADDGELGRSLLSRCDLTKGPIYTLLPLGSTIPPGTNYSSGGVTNNELSRAFLHSFLLDRAHRQPNSLILFENRYARPGDPFLGKCRSSHVALGSEVYHFWHTIQPESQLMAVIVDSATAIETAGFVVATGAAGFLGSTEEWLAACEEWLPVMIVVAAFDGEGHIIWHNSDAISDPVLGP